MNLQHIFDRGIVFSPDGGAGGSGEGNPAAGADGGRGSSDAQPKVYDEAYVTKLRNEAAEHRVKAKEYADKLNGIEDSQKTEIQKAQERAEAAEAERDRLKAEAAKAAVSTAYRDAATEAGAKSPATVAKLLMLESIKGAETGTPDAAAVVAAIDALKKSDPDLFKPTGPTARAASAGAGAGGGKASANDFFNGLLHGRR